MKSGSRIRRYIVRSVLALGGLVLLLLLPMGVQYVRYYWPNKVLPAERLDVVETYAASVAPESFRQRAAERVRQHMEEADMPGVSVAVARGDGLLWSAGFGYADIEARQPVRIDSRFRICSTAKAVTAVLLGRMVEQGKVDLDRPIGEYLPDISPHLRAITPRQLASHTAGIRHYQLRDFNIYTGNPWTMDRAGTRDLCERSASIRTGDSLQYSTYGYTLLASVMEAATGRGFLALLGEELCAPAGMVATKGDLSKADVPGRVAFYTTKDGKYTNALPQDVSYKWAGGGIVSSSLDLVRMGQALENNQLVSEGTRELLWTPVLLSGGQDNPQNYGLGWRRDTSLRLLGEDQPTLLLHHGGRQVGGASFFAIFPEHRIVAAALANTGEAAARAAVQELVFDLVRLVIDTEVAVPATASSD